MPAAPAAGQQPASSAVVPPAAGKVAATIVLAGIFVESLNPYAHSTGGIYPTWRHVLEPLVDWDFENHTWIPVLAESWTILDPNTWMFKLKHGVKFHDGGDFTSADVVYSFGRIKSDPDSKQASSLANVDRIDAVDPYTVRLHTNTTDAALLFRLRQRFITSAAAHAKGDAEGDKLAIGTGPYRFREWVPSQRFVLQKFNDYTGPHTTLANEVVFRSIKEQEPSITSLLNGEADLITNVAAENADRLTGSAHSATERDLTILFVGMNGAVVPQFKNKLVRQAVSYAINRQALTDGVLKGRAYPLDAPVGPTQYGYSPDLKPKLEYNPQKAKELLTEAGYPNGFEVEFHSQTEQYPKVIDVSTAIVSMLNAVGIRAKLVTREFTSEINDMEAGKLPFFIMGRGSVVDPSEYLHQYYQTGVTKRINYSNPEVDRVLAAEQSALDASQRETLLQQAMDVLLEEMPAAWLYQYQLIYGVSNRFEFTPAGSGEMFAWDLKPRAKTP